MKGVRFDRQANRWQARLSGCGNNGYIGSFLTRELAEEARLRAEVKLHGAPHQQPIIEVRDGVALIPLMAKNGVQAATAIVDECDLPLVQEGRWNLLKSGYAVQRRGGQLVYMHRIIEPRGEIGNHVDGNQLNNRRNNLRPCSQAQNSKNRRSLSKNNSSGIKGVTRTKSGKWRARITITGRDHKRGSPATMTAFNERATRPIDVERPPESSARFWTKDKIAQLEMLVERGDSYTKIGNAMGISKNTALGKARRLNLIMRRPQYSTQFKEANRPRRLPVLLDLRSTECAWPFGDPGEPNFHFCGQPVAAPRADGRSRPYCPEHCKKAYVRARAELTAEQKVEYNAANAKRAKAIRDAKTAKFRNRSGNL